MFFACCGQSLNVQHSPLEKSTKVHLYYCMKSCNGDAADLQCRIMNVVKHYQVSIVSYCVLGTEIYIHIHCTCNVYFAGYTH